MLELGPTLVRRVGHGKQTRNRDGRFFDRPELDVAVLHPGRSLMPVPARLQIDHEVAVECVRDPEECVDPRRSASSLGILEAMQRISPQGIQTDFQRGHTAVSAFWGLLALVSLYVGLKKRRGVLRVGGFILFAISLGKIFLYDLSSLSSVQRALSFLAVGGVLLLGGFFYQRLSAQFDDRLP